MGENKDQSHSKEHLYKSSIIKTRKGLKIRRTKVRKPIELVTGNCKFKKILYNLKLSSGSVCWGCDKDNETPLYIISQSNFHKTKNINFWIEGKDIVSYHDGVGLKRIKKKLHRWVPILFKISKWLSKSLEKGQWIIFWVQNRSQIIIWWWFNYDVWRYFCKRAYGSYFW